MSSVVISGDTSGQVTLAAPAVAGTTTITLAAQTGTLNAAGPAFSAYPSSNQSITSTTFTKILFQTTDFNTAGGMYASSTFTPTVAGYYQVQVAISPNTSTTTTQAAIYKNGSLYKRQFSTATNATCEVTALVYLNGSTDYIEGWGSLTGTTPAVQGSSDQTFFQACLVRGA